jgi:hypothetical protein
LLSKGLEIFYFGFDIFYLHLTDEIQLFTGKLQLDEIKRVVFDTYTNLNIYKNLENCSENFIISFRKSINENSAANATEFIESINPNFLKMNIVSKTNDRVFLNEIGSKKFKNLRTFISNKINIVDIYIKDGFIKNPSYGKIALGELVNLKRRYPNYEIFDKTSDKKDVPNLEYSSILNDFIGSNFAHCNFKLCIIRYFINNCYSIRPIYDTNIHDEMCNVYSAIPLPCYSNVKIFGLDLDEGYQFNFVDAEIYHGNSLGIIFTVFKVSQCKLKFPKFIITIIVKLLIN